LGTVSWSLLVTFGISLLYQGLDPYYKVDRRRRPRS
jgi:hypothetical protein